MTNFSRFSTPAFLSIFFLLLIFSSCKEDDRIPLKEEEVAYGELAFAPRAIIVSEQLGQSIQQINNGGEEIILNNPSGRLASVAAGDILVFQVTPHTPQGLLRKVVRVERSGGVFTIQTEQGLLTDAIESGSVKYRQRIGMAEIDEIILEEGVSFAGDSTGRISGLGLNFDVEKEFDDFSVSGSFSINTDAILEVDFERFAVKRMHVQVDYEETINLTAAATIGSIEFKKEIQLGKIRLIPIVVGWVVIVPELVLELDFEGKVYAGLAFSYEQQFSASAGAKYENERWEKIWNRNLDNQIRLFWPTAGMELEARLEPSIAFKIYGIVGPAFEALDVFARFEADLFANPCWEVKAGVDATFVLEAELFNHEFAVDISLENFSITVAEGECGGAGVLKGLVLDAVSRNPVAGVQVLISRDGQASASGMTNAQGGYEIQVAAGEDYEVSYSKSGYLSATRYGIDIETLVITYVEATLQIDNQYQGFGAAGGQIIDAFTGNGIPGASILVRQGYGNGFGAVVASVNTGTEGFYTIGNLPAGNYTGEASATGYTRGTFGILCLGNQTTGNNDGVISPLLPDSVVRVVLTWGQYPYDLDSHLTGPNEGGGRFHVYFADETAPDQSANLDVDDITSYGPETITILQQRPGVYRYSVHDYTNRNSTGSNALGLSGAKVKVYQGNALLAELNVPNLSGTLWTVFEMDNDDFSLINDMGYENNPSAVRSDPYDGPLLLRLPEKD